MSMGGLLAKLATLRGQKHEKPCERCGSYYNHQREEECPHCAQLNERQLEELKARRQAEGQANRRLGYGFLVAAAVVLVLILIVMAG
jgi:ribosomal protein L37E